MWNNPPGAWPRTSQLEFLITRVTTAAQPENNYALHIEIAEYINKKKANSPREAAMLIVQAVNHRNPHVTFLAIGLLDTLVQMCGYPFHLQIATKEFLNELVRRFPERPPPFPGPVMSRILDLIHGWKEGICVESRWRDDLGNIRDMHRLLSFKGYRFRDTPRTAPVPATSNLKSAEELENEDREAQSAKLQELIRRGTPRDLAAAQELMKSLAGANPDAKPDYRSQALTELNKLEQKVILLHEMLDNVDTESGEKFVKGDVYDQVATILLNSRPKIQKWISDAESDDPESLDTYLQTNDQINNVLARHEAFKRGETPPCFDSAGSSSGAGSGTSKPADDLASLFDSSVSFTSPATAPPVVAPSRGVGISALVPNNTNQQVSAISPQYTSSLPGTSTPPSRPSQFGQIKLPSTPPLQSRSQASGRVGSPGVSSPLGAARTPPSSNLAATSTLQQHSVPQATSSPPSQPVSTPQGKDPFADLVGLF
ncbi:VHS-domain-containing protein [Lactarius deliciosus]|nr:VHS-domain-containing protein [Lactarius deliciosus]